MRQFPKHTPPRRWADLGEAAEYAGVSKKTLRRWIADGRLPGYRVGPRVIRVDLDELDAYADRPVTATRN